MSGQTQDDLVTQRRRVLLEKDTKFLEIRDKANASNNYAELDKYLNSKEDIATKQLKDEQKLPSNYSRREWKDGEIWRGSFMAGGKKKSKKTSKKTGKKTSKRSSKKNSNSKQGKK